MSRPWAPLWWRPTADKREASATSCRVSPFAYMKAAILHHERASRRRDDQTAAGCGRNERRPRDLRNRWGSARSDKVAGPGLARMIPPDPRLTTGESLSAVEPIGRRPRDLSIDRAAPATTSQRARGCEDEFPDPQLSSGNSLRGKAQCGRLRVQGPDVQPYRLRLDGREMLLSVISKIAVCGRIILHRQGRAAPGFS